MGISAAHEFTDQSAALLAREEFMILIQMWMKTTMASKTICGISVGIRYEKIGDWIRGTI